MVALSETSLSKRQLKEAASPFADVSGLTLRDDAPPAVKDAATAVVRQTIQSQAARGRRVLVVPVPLSLAPNRGWWIG